VLILLDRERLTEEFRDEKPVSATRRTATNYPQ